MAVSESQLWYTFAWVYLDIYLLMLVCVSVLSVRPELELQSPFGILQSVLVVMAILKLFFVDYGFRFFPILNLVV